MPLSALLPRWFLILLAILKETDGRDKLAKCIQYGGRTLAILLEKLPAAIWWARFALAQARVGRVGDIARAVNVLLFHDRPPAAVVAVADSTLKAAAAISTVVADANFASALRASYAAHTGVLRAAFQAHPVYSGALARLEVLTAALSSARRVIRTVKWTYTLPAWAKTYASWKAQFQSANDRAEQLKQQQQQAAAEQERAEQERAAQEEAAEKEGDHPRRPRSDSTASSSGSSMDESPSPNFQFSHPHPPGLWRRLPWLSSVELLDLSLAVCTDVSDDLEWLSKYRLFPGELGAKCGRIAMCLWFSTVLLDLALTVRIVRHYRYQTWQLRLQIEEAQVEWATLTQQLALAHDERARRDWRQELRSQVRSSPLYRSERDDALEMPDPTAASAEVDPKAPASQCTPLRSGASDASWSVLSDKSERSVGSASGNSSQGGSAEGSSDEAQGPAGEHPAALTVLVTPPTADPAAAGKGSAAAAAASPRKPAQASPSQSSERALGPSAATIAAADADSDADAAADEAASLQFERLHSSSVRVYRRLLDLRAQASAIRLSLFLQHLNLAKFVFDLGAAAPMAWNVQKQHQTLVQTTGLISGIIGIYKLAITIKPAA